MTGPPLTPGRNPKRREWLVGGLAVLGAIVVAVVVLLVVTGGDDEDCCAPPDEPVTEVPPSAVAVVDGAPEELVPIEDLDPALTRAASLAGTNGVPETGDPQYELVRDQAMAELLNAAWIAGEAEERGITVPSEEEIDSNLDETIGTSFPDRQAFERFVADQAYCTEDELATVEPERCEDLRTQVRTTLLADAITSGMTPEEGEAFRTEFTEKWTARTLCAEAYVNERCSNGEPGEAPATPQPVPGVGVNP